ncbi:enoyl-CoA hydratase/isomerase family protein [Fodinicurvata halophila]|uniref:Enoyl-CoA hydratase/isomerase family protein n=1 Tax=Fodinicurvata halophila TaxID=1419723 RepID=A0ABV8UND4_9PROT
MGVELERKGSLLCLTLNREERLNALDTDMRTAIAEALNAASEDDEVRAVVLTGKGARAFCAGQDLHESQQLSPEAGDAWMDTWQRFFAAVSQCRKPIVAAVNGTAAGAGLQLALMADLRVAVPTARFLMAEINVGLPAIAGSYLLQTHLGQARMRELVLTGRVFTAEEASEWGLVQETRPPDQLLERAEAMALHLAEKPPVAMRLTLEMLRGMMRRGLSEAETAAVQYQSEAIATGEPQAQMARFFEARR